MSASITVHHAHNFRVVFIELDLDERTLKKWTEDVDQLEEKETHLDDAVSMRVERADELRTRKMD